MDLKKLKTTENRIKILNSMNIFSIEDILNHYPYKYDIIQETYPEEGNDRIIIEGTVISPARVFFKGKMSSLSLKVQDSYNNIYSVTIFNRHFLRQHLSINTIITIIGKIKGSHITASDIKIKPIKEITGIHPVYSLKEGINQSSFEKYVKKAMMLLGNIPDLIPEEYIIKHKLCHKTTALQGIHFPENKKDLIESLRYLKYEEFLKFQLHVSLIKSKRSASVGIGKVIDHYKLQNLILKLPFKLTDDQVKAVNEIIRDLESDKMMYRFMQGDVGSGKTVVSSIALYANKLAGYQGALMVPTEILARQHYATLIKFFKDTDLNIGLLTGSLSLKEKEAIYKQIENNEIDIIVGTHALFQQKVIYNNLGLVITDEQHRFGVEQRKALKNKGKQVDFLIMSATPIPRTLAISLYGDMDVTTIHTMPNGRKPIITKFIQSTSMKPILKQLVDYLKSGGQVYVVCPLVEESDSLSVRSAVQIYEAMSKYFEPDFHVGLVHGKLSEEEKNQTMNDFVENKKQILVATTVIEVGVDVPNANMMVIYDAERFGLSQLHQLRGRIGRSDQQGYCFMMSSKKDEDVVERLKFMESTNDGFEVSRFDLQMRGPGEILGNKQSGLPSFMIADIFKDMNILELARDDANEIIHQYYEHHRFIYTVELILQKLSVNNEYAD